MTFFIIPTFWLEIKKMEMNERFTGCSFWIFLIETFTRTAFDSIDIFPWRAPIPTAAKRAKSAISLGLSTCRTTHQEITMSGLKDNIFHKVCITYRSGKWQHNFWSALPSVVQFPCSKLQVPAPWQVSHKSFAHFRYLYSLCWNKFKGKLERDYDWHFPHEQSCCITVFPLTLFNVISVIRSLLRFWCNLVASPKWDTTIVPAKKEHGRTKSSSQKPTKDGLYS